MILPSNPGSSFGPKDVISIDGNTGEVFGEALKPEQPKGITGDFKKVLGWADEYRRLGVRTNADTPADAKRARVNIVPRGACACAMSGRLSLRAPDSAAGDRKMDKK